MGAQPPPIRHSPTGMRHRGRGRASRRIPARVSAWPTRIKAGLDSLMATMGNVGQWLDQLGDILPESLVATGDDVVQALMSWLEGIDWEQLLRRVTDSIDTVLVNAVGAVSATVNIVVTASFALIISVYMSVGSESLCHHARTLVCAYLKPSHSAWLLKFCRLFRQSFANFLTGQCSEAVILGVLMALAFSVFKIPYGSLVGMLTAICAIIPYVGALISCVVSVFLVLLVDPVLAVRCLIVYLAVQFIENQFIYPRVVGKSVGLSPLYTLVAAMIGGELFGIIGIIFFIPLTAVIIELVKEDACRRIQAREPQRSGPSE